jgi:hypothetical protein
MSLFSYHGGVPAPLPLELEGANFDSLVTFGYAGPFSRPVYNPRLQELQWSGSEWSVVNFSNEQLALNEYSRLLSRADWTGFSEKLMGSSAYGKARAGAATSLQTNVTCTELIALLADARAGRPHVDGINACFAAIGNEIVLTDEDKAELFQLARDFGLSTFLTAFDYQPPLDSFESNGESA